MEPNWSQRARLARGAWLAANGGDDWNAKSHPILYAYDIEGSLDEDALAASVRYLGWRHDALRARFTRHGDNPSLTITADELTLERLTDGPHHPAELSAWLAANAAACALDIYDGPICGFVLAPWQRPQGGWLLLVCLEHIVVDGHSVGIVIRELSEAYRAYVTHGEPQLSRPLQIGDALAEEARWLGTDEADTARDFWHDRLHDHGPWPQLQLGADVVTGKGLGRSSWHNLDLPVEDTAAVRAYVREHARTPFFLMVATLMISTHLEGDVETVGVVTAVRNRPGLEWEETVGWMSNLVALTHTVRPDRTLGQELLDVRADVLDALEHGRYPIHRLTHEMTRPAWGRPRQHPCLHLDVTSEAEFDLSLEGLDVTEVPTPRGAVQPGLGLWVREAHDTISLGLAHSEGFLDADRAQRFLHRISQVLTAIVTNDSVRVKDL